MSTAKTTIELNGNLYDARTGKIIGETSGRGSIDGVSRVVNRVPVKPSVSRTQPAHVKHPVQKSQTLMRPAVKKPTAVTTHDVLSYKHEITKKQDPARHARAVSVPKSPDIRKYNAITHRIVKTSAPLAVAKPGVTAQIAHLATATETQMKHSVDAIEESIRTASAHLQKFDDRVLRKRFIDRVGFGNRTANLASLSFAGLLLFGFFAYQNAPNIEMRVAATRSGVAAGLPSYKPAGFGVAKNITAEPGKVAVSFRSNADSRKFILTQKASNWSSDTLLANQVLASKQSYQTFQSEGKTVFIYDNSNATWVNKGVLYNVDGNASLSSDQLLRLANSL